MPTSRSVVAGLVGLVIVWPWVSLVANIGNLVQSALGGATPPDVAHLTLDALREHVHEPAAWGVALVVVTLTPLTEEVVWRGAVQQALKRLGIPRLAAIGCTAVLFAMVHWNAVPDASRLSALPALAMLGFTLGWLMERTGRLIAPVAAHAAFNAFQFQQPVLQQYLRHLRGFAGAGGRGKDQTAVVTKARDQFGFNLVYGQTISHGSRIVPWVKASRQARRREFGVRLADGGRPCVAQIE
jgi:membrane protease YdiL (CAAX protease family)